MISTKEVFDRMKRYRRERNQLRQEMEKLKGLPQQILALQQQVANLEKQVNESSTTINLEELRHELLTEVDNKIEHIVNKLSEDLSLCNVDNINDIETSASLEKEITNFSSDETNHVPEISTCTIIEVEDFSANKNNNSLESEHENQRMNNISCLETENV